MSNMNCTTQAMPICVPAVVDGEQRAFDQVREILRTWRQRYQSRARLARLASHQLDDIGITEAEREAEVAKYFWEV